MFLVRMSSGASESVVGPSLEYAVMSRVVKCSTAEAIKTSGSRAQSLLPRWIPPQLCQPPGSRRSRRRGRLNRNSSRGSALGWVQGRRRRAPAGEGLNLFFHGGVPDNRFDGRSAAQFALYCLGDPASLAGDVDLEPVFGRSVVAAIAAVGDDAGQIGAEHFHHDTTRPLAPNCRGGFSPCPQSTSRCMPSCRAD